MSPTSYGHYVFGFRDNSMLSLSEIWPLAPSQLPLCRHTAGTHSNMIPKLIEGLVQSPHEFNCGWQSRIGASSIHNAHMAQAAVMIDSQKAGAARLQRTPEGFAYPAVPFSGCGCPAGSEKSAGSKAGPPPAYAPAMAWFTRSAAPAI